jgi:nuclear pore complex protein Nup160
MAAAQDCLLMQWKVCFSQLILLVHMEFEFDNEEDALHHRVNIGPVYCQLIGALKRLALLRWLSNTEVTVPLFKPEKGAMPKKGTDDTQVVTALETTVGHLLGFSDADSQPLQQGIAGLIANLCASDSDVEVSPPIVQCSLIRRERADLASDMTPFCDESPFAVYVQGRVNLALKELHAAAICFRRAAVGMSKCNHFSL